MKNLLILFFGLVLTISFTACEKEGPIGPQGPQGATGATGQSALDAKTFNYSLTFTSSDTWQSYGGITGYDADDVIITYIYSELISGDQYWTQIPYNNGSVHYYPQFSQSTGYMFINTAKSNGTSGSPWASTVTRGFKSVLIKSSQRAKQPDLDYSDYLQVKEAFNLED